MHDGGEEVQSVGCGGVVLVSAPLCSGGGCCPPII